MLHLKNQPFRAWQYIYVDVFSHTDTQTTPQADERLPWFAETEATLSVDIVGVEFNLNGLPDNAVHISGF
jgi:hypothetical protein